MSPPRITVITVNQDRADCLEPTICSVLDQGYENLEYLVVDGGSTDGSRQVVELYGDDLAWWTSEPTPSPADALNRALARATGEIVGVLHSGDIYLPGTLDAAARLMTAGNEPPTWIVGDCLRIGPRDQSRGRFEAQAPRSVAELLMHDSGVLPIASTFWRRELFHRHGCFDRRLQYAFDYEFYCRLMLEGHRPTVVPEVFAARRELADRTSPVRAIEQGLEYLAAARRYAPALPVADRYALWRNCEARQRIYALAQAELHHDHARRLLASELVKHPWWLVDDAVRQVLVRGVSHPTQVRPAA